MPIIDRKSIGLPTLKRAEARAPVYEMASTFCRCSAAICRRLIRITHVNEFSKISAATDRDKQTLLAAGEPLYCNRSQFRTVNFDHYFFVANDSVL